VSGKETLDCFDLLSWHTVLSDLMEFRHKNPGSFSVFSVFEARKNSGGTLNWKLRHMEVE